MKLATSFLLFVFIACLRLSKNASRDLQSNSVQGSVDSFISCLTSLSDNIANVLSGYKKEMQDKTIINLLLRPPIFNFLLDA